MQHIIPGTFSVPLSPEQHYLAEQFSCQQSNREKARQVYLNTLAVFAVEFYLRCMSIETDWKASLSWNPVAQTLIDVADLVIPGVGKLECRPVLPEEQIVQISPDVLSDRIGYITVRIDKSLRRATLLGFSKTAPLTGELHISELHSLEDLLKHLAQLNQHTLIEMRTNLNQWFQKGSEPSWQSIEEVLGTKQKNLASSFRSGSQLDTACIKRAKLINLGIQLESQAVVLIVIVTKEAHQEEVTITVQVHPGGGDTYLPANIRLVLLLESGEILDEAESRSLDNFIQLNQFEGLTGECFNILVASSEASVTESFVI